MFLLKHRSIMKPKYKHCFI